MKYEVSIGEFYHAGHREPGGPRADVASAPRRTGPLEHNHRLAQLKSPRSALGRHLVNTRSEGSTLSALALGALGVVYGDIGTSPLYVMQTVFDPANGLALNRFNVLGIVSLIFWSLMVVVKASARLTRLWKLMMRLRS